MTDRNTNTARPLRPTVAAPNPRLIHRNTAPLTPRVAARAPSKTPSTVRSEPATKVTSRMKQAEGSADELQAVGNVTPRSSARRSRLFERESTVSPSEPRESGGPGGIARAGRPRSLVTGEDGAARGRSPPLVRSPGRVEMSRQDPGSESIDARFFHASDMPTAAPPPQKKPETKRTPTFVYADGQQEQDPHQPLSPVLSAVSSSQQSSGPWIRSKVSSNPNVSKSPPMLSPALSSLSSASPFFAPATTAQPERAPKGRSPSPTKDNIHLSYRKGASQIFGTLHRNPTTPPAPPLPSQLMNTSKQRKPSFTTPHKKSPSLSSIDSGSSPHDSQARRRSATHLDPLLEPSPLANLPTTPGIAPTSPGPTIQESAAPLSPTKSISELAADARRERKVLDLEISNSSLLAINSSLEREIRRQKAELKRFRRLSRAGRLGRSTSATFSALDGVSDEDEEDGGRPSGITDLYSESSGEDEDEEGSSEGRSSLGGHGTEHRLAADEKRLRLDLQRHKELLVQSQSMNQSLKRCLYSTEEMIREGKKALEYHVRVSDVKLGGRVLYANGEGEEGELEATDEFLGGEGEDGGGAAEDFLKVWQGIGTTGRNAAGVECGGGTDRDSGIEADSLPGSVRRSALGGGVGDRGRPPDI